MRLADVTVQLFRNFVDAQTIKIEDDVTCLVGKNESGKTTILKALHRLNPANGSDRNFDLTTEYPRWRLAPDRRRDANLKNTRPVAARFELDAHDLEQLEGIFGASPPPATVCHAARSYTNQYHVWLACPALDVIREAATDVEIGGEDLERLLAAADFESARDLSKSLAKELRDSGEPLRGKAIASFATSLTKYDFLGRIDNQEQRESLAALIPRFFYFSSYSVLPGECDLNALNDKLENEEALTDEDRTVVSLLAHAGETPADFMEASYDSRKAELQAASTDLSRSAFEYWKQNTDLEVIFDTDNVVHHVQPTGNEVTHRILKVELRDGRHGNVETNFSTRSTGFQWFFSFFAAFSEFQDSSESIIVLLDEPGTSLHGDAQRDFIRFILEELGASKQTVYTTHSQHMVNPAKYEKLRAVHDRATREDPDRGVVVTLADLSADRDTILPVESALGYSVSQHLFLGSGQHLAVEGSSDFVYLQRMTEHMLTSGRQGLDPKLAVIPVGGVDNMPAFVALLGRRLKVSALVDGARTSAKLARIQAAAEHNGVPTSSIVTCSQVTDKLPSNADIEDLFDTVDYLRLYNWAFDAKLKVSDLPATEEPIIRRITGLSGEYDHALPAHALTEHREEFFGGIKAKSASNFEKLFALLNATISP